jgi:hypothetical protein
MAKIERQPFTIQQIGAPAPSTAPPATVQSSGHSLTTAQPTQKTSWGKTALKVIAAIFTLNFSKIGKAIGEYRTARTPLPMGHAVSGVPPQEYERVEHLFNLAKAPPVVSDYDIATIRAKLAVASAPPAVEVPQVSEAASSQTVEAPEVPEITSPRSGEVLREVRDAGAASVEAAAKKALEEMRGSAPVEKPSHIIKLEEAKMANEEFVAKLSPLAQAMGEGLEALAKATGRGDTGVGEKAKALGKAIKNEFLAKCTTEGLKEELQQKREGLEKYLDQFVGVKLEGFSSFGEWLNNNDQGRTESEIQKLVWKAQKWLIDDIGETIKESNHFESFEGKEAGKFLDGVGGNPKVDHFVKNVLGYSDVRDWAKHGSEPKTPNDLKKLLTEAQADLWKSPVELPLSFVDRFISGNLKLTSLEDFRKAYAKKIGELESDPENMASLFRDHSSQMRDAAEETLQLPMQLLRRSLNQQAFIMYKGSHGIASKFLNAKGMHKALSGEKLPLSYRMTMGAYNRIFKSKVEKELGAGIRTDSVANFLQDGIRLATGDDRRSFGSSFSDDVFKASADCLAAATLPTLELFFGGADKVKEERGTTYKMKETGPLAQRAENAFKKGKLSVEQMPEFLQSLANS